MRVSARPERKRLKKAARAPMPELEPTPPMLSIDNVGIARLHWSTAAIYMNDGKLFIEANGIIVTINKTWSLSNLAAKQKL